MGETKNFRPIKQTCLLKIQIQMIHKHRVQGSKERLDLEICIWEASAYREYLKAVTLHKIPNEYRWEESKVQECLEETPTFRHRNNEEVLAKMTEGAAGEMGRELISKWEWCPGSPVSIFQEGKSDQLCQMITDKDYKD